MFEMSFLISSSAVVSWWFMVGVFFFYLFLGLGFLSKDEGEVWFLIIFFIGGLEVLLLSWILEIGESPSLFGESVVFNQSFSFLLFFLLLSIFLLILNLLSVVCLEEGFLFISGETEKQVFLFLSFFMELICFLSFFLVFMK